MTPKKRVKKGEAVKAIETKSVSPYPKWVVGMFALGSVAIATVWMTVFLQKFGFIPANWIGPLMGPLVYIGIGSLLPLGYGFYRGCRYYLKRQDYSLKDKLTDMGSVMAFVATVIPFYCLDSVNPGARLFWAIFSGIVFLVLYLGQFIILMKELWRMKWWKAFWGTPIIMIATIALYPKIIILTLWGGLAFLGRYVRHNWLNSGLMLVLTGLFMISYMSLSAAVLLGFCLCMGIIPLIKDTWGIRYRWDFWIKIILLISSFLPILGVGMMHVWSNMQIDICDHIGVSVALEKQFPESFPIYGTIMAFCALGVGAWTLMIGFGMIMGLLSCFNATARRRCRWVFVFAFFMLSCQIFSDTRNGLIFEWREARPYCGSIISDSLAFSQNQVVLDNKGENK